MLAKPTTAPAAAAQRSVPPDACRGRRRPIIMAANADAGAMPPGQQAPPATHAFTSMADLQAGLDHLRTADAREC